MDGQAEFDTSWEVNKSKMISGIVIDEIYDSGLSSGNLAKTSGASGIDA